MTQTPSDDLGPLYTLVQVGSFESDWADLNLENEDLRLLEQLILSDPQGPPIITGTGGARKIRFAPKQWNVGKSGAVRVIYAIFIEFGVVLLLVAYAKNERDNLSAKQKSIIKDFLNRTEPILKNGKTKYAPHQ